MEKDTNIILRVNSQLKENVSKIAEDYGVSLSELITACLKDLNAREMIPINIRRHLPSKFAKQNQITILLIKHALENILRKQAHNSVKKVYLFGSFARGEQTSKSDVDLRFETDDSYSLVDHSNIRLDLIEALNRDVDIITADYDHLDDQFVKNIRKDEICIYENERQATVWAHS